MNHPPSTIAQKLALMQLADSFFPSGAYTLSHGLESLIQQQQIKQSEDLISFIQILLSYKIATCDLVALLHAYNGSVADNLATIITADNQLFAQTLIATTRKTQQQSGRALLMVAQNTWQHQQLTKLEQAQASNQFYCLHPIIFGVVGNIIGLSAIDTALGFIHGLVTGILSAAIRLGILGHRKAQKILFQLAPEIEAVYLKAASLNLDQMCSCTPTIDIAQMRHSQLSMRLFAS